MTESLRDELTNFEYAVLRLLEPNRTYFAVMRSKEPARKQIAMTVEWHGPEIVLEALGWAVVNKKSLTEALIRADIRAEEQAIHHQKALDCPETNSGTLIQAMVRAGRGAVTEALQMDSGGPDTSKMEDF